MMQPTTRTVAIYDEYRKLDQPSEVRRGDLVVYHDATGPSHIGVVWERYSDFAQAKFVFSVLSQWGSDGEFFHALAQVVIAVISWVT